MKHVRMLLGASGFVLALAMASWAQVKVLPTHTVTIAGTVETIDHTKRVVTIRTATDEFVTVDVPEGAKRFNELKVGDTVQATYNNNVTVRLKPLGEPAVDTAKVAKTGGEGERPGGMAAMERTMTATITAINKSASSITFVGPNNWKYSRHVVDPTVFDQVKVGDRVDITWNTDVTVAVLADRPSPPAPPVRSTQCPGPEGYGLLEAISGSIGGHYDARCHTPLGLDNFFKGWLDAWIPVGAGSSGALRGGWVNAPNGFFSREVDPQYSFTNGHGDAPNEHLGTVTLFTPLSRRLELGVVVPFIDAFNPGQTSFGDVTVIPRFMLSETRDLGVTTGLAIRTPTGDTDTGNGQTRVDPFVAVWADLGHAWQLRSGFDVNVVTDRDVLPGLPDAVLTVNLSIGKTFTLNEGGYFSDITPYLATTSVRPSAVATARISPSTT